MSYLRKIVEGYFLLVRPVHIKNNQCLKTKGD